MWQSDQRISNAFLSAHHTLRDDLVVLGRAFTLTFFEPIVLLWDLYTALHYGILFTWFESFPLVFGGVYGFDTHEQGLVFLGIFLGGLVTLPLFPVVDQIWDCSRVHTADVQSLKRSYHRRFRRGGTPHLPVLV